VILPYQRNRGGIEPEYGPVMKKTAWLLILIASLVSVRPADAQPAPGDPGRVEAVGFDRIVRTVAAETRLTAPAAARRAQAGPAPRARRGVGKRILGGIAGGVGGFFAGAYIGAAIDGECGGCDDPGLKGALIGMPIGAAIGAWAGQRWLF
jgi:hypothetical protein